MELNYKIKKDDLSLTIHQILIREFDFSTRFFHKLVKDHFITLNGLICDTRIFPQENDFLKVDLGFEESSGVIPTEMDLTILYEDDYLLILDKPAGIAIHPSLLHYEDSLSNGVSFYFQQIGLKKKIRPVNRLDSNTSGLVIFAKCEYIQDQLSKQMQDHSFTKKYLAFCEGVLKEKKEFKKINLPIGRKKDSIIERCICSEGQPSITLYQVLESFTSYSLVECILETGRTHQIRVHMAAIGHPLLGDSLYGHSSSLIARQALHCYCLSFYHPVFQKEMFFSSELPDDMKSLILSF